MQSLSLPSCLHRETVPSDNPGQCDCCKLSKLSETHLAAAAAELFARIIYRQPSISPPTNSCGHCHRGFSWTGPAGGTIINTMIGWQWVSRVLPAKASLDDTALSLMPLFCATGAFDGDAFMLDGLPAWTAHLEPPQAGTVPGDLRAVSWSSFALRYAVAFTGSSGSV
jgi:hypothetical protein